MKTSSIQGCEGNAKFVTKISKTTENKLSLNKLVVVECMQYAYLCQLVSWSVWVHTTSGTTTEAIRSRLLSTIMHSWPASLRSTTTHPDMRGHSAEIHYKPVSFWKSPQAHAVSIRFFSFGVGKEQQIKSHVQEFRRHVFLPTCNPIFFNRRFLSS